MTGAGHRLGALVFLSSAALLCIIVFAGWILDQPRLSGLGSGIMVMQPLTVLAHGCIAIGLFTATRRRFHLAALVLTIPLGIAIMSLLEHGFAIDLSIDRLMFRAAVMREMRAHPGRTGLMPAVMILFLTIAILLSLTTNLLANKISVVLCCLTIAIAMMSSAAFPLGLLAHSGQGGVPELYMPFSVGLIAMLNAFGAMVWRGDRVWPGASSLSVAERWRFRTMFALCQCAPILFALIELWLSRHAHLHSQSLQILHAMAQSAISMVILLWAWTKISSNVAKQERLIWALNATSVIITTPTGEIVYWSDGCERLYQWTAKEAVGRTKHDLLRSSAEYPVSMSGLAGLVEREIVEHKRDGTPINILEHIRLIDAEAARSAVVVLSMTDITERKKAQEALRASDARLKLAVEAHGIGIFEWVAKTDMVTLSAEAQRLLGIAVSAFAGNATEVERLVSARFSRQFSPELEVVVANSLPRVGLFLRSILPTGRPRRIDGSARLFYADDGSCNRMLGILFDGSEHERHAAELEERESRLRAILDTVPEALVTIDTDGTIRFFSATAETLFGYSAAEAVGRNIIMLVPEHLRVEYRQRLENYVDHVPLDPAESNRRMSFLHRDGSEIMVQLAVGEAVAGNDRILTIFIRDLREQIASEARLAELREELLHVSRLSAMGEMAAGLAHELNQPLAAMSNFLGAASMLLANQDGGTSRVTELLKLAARQAMRAGEIITRVRTFVSKGDVEFAQQKVDELITDSIDLALTSVERKDLEIEINIDTAHDRIFADRVQIQQVIVNMITNAIEAIRDARSPRPKIIFTARGTKDGMVEISLQDSGPGIPADILNRNHEHFVSTKTYGMGIGLSICRRIVEAHHGQMSTGNHPGGGAIVRFTIPAYPEDEGSAS
jgi:two-component system sensor kinase FixL